MSAVFDPFELARQVDILDLIENQYGLETQRIGRLTFTSCPKPGSSDSSPSVAIYVDQNRFHCYHCGDWFGTPIDFVMGIEGFTSVQDALKHLDKLYPNLGIVNPEGRKRADTVGRYYAYTEKLLKEDRGRLKGSERYLSWVRNGRGFSESAVDHFSLGVRDFNNVPRLMIPQFGPSGQVLAFVSRQMSPKDPMSRYFAKNVDLNPDSGMMVRKDEKVKDPIPVFRKGQYLYNLSRVKDRTVCLVEGHLDVIAGWEMGVENIVACGTNVISDGQVELLSRFDSVTLIPDLDMLDRVIDNVRVIRMQLPHMPILVVDMTVLGEDVKKDVNDALIYLSEQNDVEMFQLMVSRAIPVEQWMFAYHVIKAESEAAAFIQLQKVLDVSTHPVSRVALCKAAGEYLNLPAELLYK